MLDSAPFHTNRVVVTSTFATAGQTSAAAFKLTSQTSGAIVWAYAVTKGLLGRGNQSVAEACAKHLKDMVARLGPPAPKKHEKQK